MELSQVERTKLTTRLEKLIRYAGDYGMEGNLEIAVQAAKFGWDVIPEETAPLRRRISTINEDNDWDEAIKIADGRDVWYTIVETVADGVMPHRPEWVTKISLKHAERLMSEVKSKNYPSSRFILG